MSMRGRSVERRTLAAVGAVGQVGGADLEALHLLLGGPGGIVVVGALGGHGWGIWNYALPGSKKKLERKAGPG
jgi:hypothetical protein